ncbi:Rod1 protein [Martiniozyma asiatica (nom. inval.)]|nr:Rod1 protein [Martiniozyma asiatica]
MPKQSKNSKLPLFDVRLRTDDKDTIVLKGAPNQAPPAVLSGVVAMSVRDPIHIKKMKLKLYATMLIQWDEKYHTSKGQNFVRPFKFSKIVHCYEWDTIDLQGFLHTHDPLNASFITPETTGDASPSAGFLSGKLTRSNPGSATSLYNLSSTNLKDLQNSQRNKSSTNLKTSNSHSSFQTKYKSSSNLSMLGFGGGGGSSSGGLYSSQGEVVLQPGNYEFPFYTLIDGSVPESIIGHKNCSIVYRLQASIERGRFSTPIITRRLVNIVRTLTADNPELSETIAVDNTWPGKVDYSISVPAKAMAIGSACRVDMDLVPLMKGLKLGSIKIKLAEYSSFHTSSGNHVEEHTLTTKHISKVVHDHEGRDIWSDDTPMDQDGVFFRSHNMTLSQDRWEIQTYIQLPPSLAKMTQDCDIGGLVKIRHKLKFAIGLVNPDGHVSELRATLPITLFISPFLPIKVKTLNDYDDPFQVSSYEDASVNPGGSNYIFQNEEAINTRLLQANSTNVSIAEDSEVPEINSNTQHLMAPPNYGDRVYDRLFNPNKASAVNQDSFEDPSFNSTTHSPVSGLASGAERRTNGVATFSFGGDDDDDDLEDDDDVPPLPFGPVISGPAFNTGSQMPISRISSQVNMHHAPTPGHTTPIQHLSRATSLVNTPHLIHNQSNGYFNLNLNSNLNVNNNGTNANTLLDIFEPPSYDDALRSDIEPEELTPAYEGPKADLRMNLDLLDTRLKSIHLSRHGNDSTSSLKVHPSGSVADSSRLSQTGSTTQLNGTNLTSYISSIRSQNNNIESGKTTPGATLSRAASSNSIFNLWKHQVHPMQITPNTKSHSSNSIPIVASANGQQPQQGGNAVTIGHLSLPKGYSISANVSPSHNANESSTSYFPTIVANNDQISHPKAAHMSDSGLNSNTGSMQTSNTGISILSASSAYSQRLVNNHKDVDLETNEVVNDNPQKKGDAVKSHSAVRPSMSTRKSSGFLRSFRKKKE